MTTEQRINQHIVSELGETELRSVHRVQLQDMLDRKAAAGASFSVVNHLRFDLRQVFRFAVAEGFIERNPAEMLFTPRDAVRGVGRVATADEMAQAFAALDLRERLMFKLAGIAGMRPGEIFALTWQDLEDRCAVVRRRVYQGEIDTPKSLKSARRVALGDGLAADVRVWRSLCVNTAPDAWVFPSEAGTTPLRVDNTRHYRIERRLKAIGLEWMNFQVLRRSCASLMSDKGVDGKVSADQLGHTLDVNQNVYTRVAFERQEEAVNRLDSLFPVT